VRRWLAALLAQVEEMIDLSHDATRTKKERVVPRAHVCAELERTSAVLRRLLRGPRDVLWRLSEQLTRPRDAANHSVRAQPSVVGALS
jgi:hypothetical protein